MKPHIRLPLPAVTLALSAFGFLVPASAQEKTDFGLVAGTVANMLMESHYSQQDFDDDLSRKALQNYFDYLDYNRMYFTAPEIDQFRAKYETQLDDFVVQYKLTPANEIYNLYAKRVNERSAKIKALIESGKLDFNTPEAVAITRKNAPWPKDEAELDTLWAKQITREILQERLNSARIEERKKEKAAKEAEKAATEKPAEEAKPAEPAPAPAPAPAAEAPPEGKAAETPVAPGGLPELVKKAEKVEKKPDTPEQKVLKRYERFLEIIKENDEEDVTNYFLSAIATAYDPHSEYMSAPEQDSFNIEMKKSLIGIGAQLRQKDGAAEIVMLIPGGPAEKGGQLKVGDLVTGVGEGLEGEMKDVEGLKLQKIVEMIRGGENTVVRLRLQPAEDPTTSRDIMIQRAKVEMKDTLAKAELIELNKPNTSPLRVGWITLDSFYADMENMGKKDARSATRDVKALLQRLIKENVSGVVLDLRNNGGGSLEEAIRLTGLFTKAGPVVQQRDNRDHSETRYSRGAEPVYAGPLIVVTDRASASASEICAGALQDTGRALIVGDNQTFGKGTVQTILDVGGNMPIFSAKDRAGSLKVTIQKFYRIDGKSTQKEGVSADISFPSRFDAMEVGEEFLNGPLPWDEIKAVPYETAPGPALPKEELKSRSKARVATNPEFNYIQDYVTRTKDLLKRNTVSLNEQERLKEDAENNARLKQQREERKVRIAEANKDGDPYKVFPLTLDTVGQVQLKTDAEVKKDAKKEFSLRLDEDEEEGGAAEEEETYPHGIEPVKAETLHIVRDMLELTPPATAKSTAKTDR